MDKGLRHLRNKIDATDTLILSALGKRMKIVRKIGAYKRKNKLNSVDKKRWGELVKTRTKLGSSKGLPASFVKRLYQLIHAESVALQKKK